MRMMKTIQMTNREITKLSLNMLMSGQLKNKKPRRNRNNQISLLISPFKPPESQAFTLGFQCAATAGYTHMCRFVSYHISCSISI